MAFYRDYVAQSRPCIITNAFGSWPALKKWDIAYLRRVAGDVEISADLTPSGHGDCVVPAPNFDPKQPYITSDSVPEGEPYDPSRCFVKPHQSKIRFSQFLDAFVAHQDKLRGSDSSASDDEVYYLQHQNDSFRQEFMEVLGRDLDASVEKWGTDLFGGAPDAINFWMGDSRAVSSMHKDHYENLYCVVKGTKVFTLCCPTDLPWMNQTWFREASFERVNGSLTPILQEPEHAIPWIPIDPDWNTQQREQANPRASRLSPLQVHVHEGEMLYLPALVYHKVAQIGDEAEGKVIAINYWWDMQFGASYCWFKLLESLVLQRDARERESAKQTSSSSQLT